MGMSVGPIPFTAIVEYAKLYEVAEDEFDEFIYIIRAMDSEYLKQEKKASKGSNANSNTGKANRGKN
jgi:hypothetical protein